MEKPAATSRPIHDLLARRWSPRAFDSARTISRDTLTALLEAARWAPSSFGEEPWAFVVCPRDDEESWEKAKAALVEGNRGWAQNAALLILVCANPHFSKNGKPNSNYAYDTGAAAISLVFQAEAMGLRAHQMSGFDANRAREFFHVPDEFECLAMIAVGCQSAAESLPEGRLREAESAPRSRRPLAEKFFAGEWGKGFGE